MKVFVSYGQSADQWSALRLQALAAAHGFTVYVPPSYTRQSPLLDSESEQKIRESDIVLGMVGLGLSDACRHELNAAQAAGKPAIVMANPGHAALFQNLGWNVVEIDPSHPEQSELGIVQKLRNVQAERSKNALIAFGTLALGLLVVAALAPQE